MADAFDELDFEYVTGVAEKAMGAITAQRVPPTPHNFHVWFKYALGTPVELKRTIDILIANKRKFDPASNRDLYTTYVGSKGTDGVAGFIKAALALRHGEVPPSLHFREANPHIPFADLPLRVVTQAQPWPVRGRPGRAGAASRRTPPAPHDARHETDGWRRSCRGSLAKREPRFHVGIAALESG